MYTSIAVLLLLNAFKALVFETTFDVIVHSTLVQAIMAHFYETELKRPTSPWNFANDVVDYWAGHSPSGHLAMHWVSGDLKSERKLTFKYFSQQSNRFAILFREKLGLKQGEKLLIIMPRVPVWWEIATGCIRSGIVVCPATTLLVDKDIEYRANRSGAAVFIGDVTSVQKLLKIKKNCPKIKHILQIGDSQVPDGVISLSKELQSIPETSQYTGPIPGLKAVSMIYLCVLVCNLSLIQALTILKYIRYDRATENGTTQSNFLPVGINHYRETLPPTQARIA